MDCIDSIEIRYYRSIYLLRLSGLKDLTVITGQNDSGKSNIIKALNLFFNQKTDWGSDYSNFYDEFSIKRKNRVAAESVHGQQFISIKITFKRGNRMTHTLPPKFSVIKRYTRNSLTPTVNSNDVFARMKALCDREGRTYSRTKTEASLNKFLNSLVFVYIPAVKDNSVFDYVLRMLQKNIFSGQDQSLLETPIESVNTKIDQLMHELQLSFKSSTDIDSLIEIPNTLDSLQGLLDIETRHDPKSKEIVTIQRRGDGIKAHYIPQILDYISGKSRKYYIWGFEEPETSYEFRRCAQVAEEFKNRYCVRNQIFVTTHSPAFYNNSGKYKTVVRVVKDEYETKKLEDTDRLAIDKELGISALYEEYVEKASQLLIEKENMAAELSSLNQIVSSTNLPVIFTEGKTDALILNTARNKLDLPDGAYFIRECDANRGHSKKSDGGATRLKALLESYAEPANTERIVIGLFDYDKEGIDCFTKLNKNFVEEDLAVASDFSIPYKKRKAGNVFALCLPPSRNCQQYADAKNLCIEYMFDETVLKSKHNKRGLKFKPGTIIQTYAHNGQSEVIDNPDECARQITGNKTLFAEEIVPTLGKESFDSFHILFQVFDSLIKLVV